MPTRSVNVVWPALEKAWRKTDYQEIWLQFRPRGAASDVFDDVEAAVAAANEQVEQAGWGDGVFTEGVSDSEAGPVALMSRAGLEAGVHAWFDAFAGHLEARGRSGSITSAPQAHFPWSFSDMPQQLTAFVSYRTVDLTVLDEQQRRAGWNVPSELTQNIARQATRWGQFDGGRTYLRRNIHQHLTSTPEVGPLLADGVKRFGYAGVTCLRSEPRRSANVNFAWQGQGCYGVMDAAASWQKILAKVTQALLFAPEETNLAFVQHSSAYTIAWDDLSSATPRLPHVREHDIRYNRHLISSYVPDAHGIQLLTDAHLDHARDLSDWDIEPLTGGRHLVKAHHLDSWYASLDPEPETLAKARHDFGDMILTLDTVASNPPPWA